MFRPIVYRVALACAVVAGSFTPARAQPATPAAVEGDYVARDFRFGTGETLPELRLHYRTPGTPPRDASGGGRNAGLILPGPGRKGRGFSSRTRRGGAVGA